MLSLGKLSLLACVALGQAVFLGGMIVVDRLPIQYGETIRLKVEPVDPRDLFRGDYVILGYDFSRRTADAVADRPANWSEHGRSGEEVFIRLKLTDDGEYWVTDSLTAQQPKDGTYLRGTFSRAGFIDAGIGAYYVQEGEGRRIEEAIRRERPVFADVAVWKGTARLKGVVVE